MNKKRIVFLIVLLMIVMTESVFSAKTVMPDDARFYMSFYKPPKDEFYFSDPAFTGTGKPDYYPNTSGGVAFSSVDASDVTVAEQGYPSTAYVGVTSKMESRCKVEVFCNSKPDLSSSYCMDMVANPAIHLNYKVEKYANLTDAEKAALPTELGAIDVKVPVYVHTHDSDIPETTTVVLKLIIIAEYDSVTENYTPYTEGTYEGYLVIKSTPLA